MAFNDAGPTWRLIKRLLADDGSLWITIDDNESALSRVVMDEIFGRANFIATVDLGESLQPNEFGRNHLSRYHDYRLVLRQRREQLARNLLQLYRVVRQDGSDIRILTTIHRGSLEAEATSPRGITTALELPDYNAPDGSKSAGRRMDAIGDF